MILTRIYPGTPETLDLGAPDGVARLSELYRVPEPAWLRINLVSSVNGNAAGSDGTSQSLTSRTDRTILGVIRRASDVVLVGAASVRAEGHLRPRTAPLAVVTGSGDLSGHRIRPDLPAGDLIVLCPASALGRLQSSLDGLAVEIITIPGDDRRLRPANIVAALRDRGLGRIVCEGGPSLAAQLLDAGLVDELCLTTSPVVNGVRLPLLGDAPLEMKRLSLAQLLVDEASALYARWSV